jgi:hypothetical protein
MVCDNFMTSGKHRGTGADALPAARIAHAAAQDADDPAWIGATQFAYMLPLSINVATCPRRGADLVGTRPPPLDR